MESCQPIKRLKDKKKKTNRLSYYIPINPHKTKKAIFFLKNSQIFGKFCFSFKNPTSKIVLLIRIVLIYYIYSIRVIIYSFIFSLMMARYRPKHVAAFQTEKIGVWTVSLYIFFSLYICIIETQPGHVAYKNSIRV
jgi:hypothetical protein